MYQAPVEVVYPGHTASQDRHQLYLTDTDSKYAMFKKLNEDMQTFISRKENYRTDLTEN